jgi:hypothetical protein
MESNKLCPYRKEIIVTDYHWEGDTPLPAAYEEGFAQCYGNLCAAWVNDSYTGFQGCALARKLIK